MTHFIFFSRRPARHPAPLKPGALIAIHGLYDDYLGVLLVLYPETGRARVRFYDPILEGGCWREIGVDIARLSRLERVGDRA